MPRLEQYPFLKKAMETRLDEFFKMGMNPEKVDWELESRPGTSELSVKIKVVFGTMKSPHDPETQIPCDSFAEKVSGSVVLMGTDVISPLV